MIFKYLDYRLFIKAWVQNKKEHGKKFSYQVLAERIQMQKSYLSRILSGDAFLGQDQAYLLAEELSLKSLEKKYLFLLVEYDRTSILKRKNEILSQIKGIQNKQMNTEHFLKKSLHDNNLFSYYSNPFLQILHITLLTGLANVESLNKIKNQLGVSDETLYQSIEKLKELKIISCKNGVYLNEAKGLHLRDHNIMTKINHFLMRQYSLSQMNNLPKDQEYSFSATFSANENTFLEIKSEFLLFLKKIESSIDQARPDNSYQVNFDLFPWIIRS